MRIWIDLANSPHPLLFTPVARELESAGHEILVTARDNAQTVELAREVWDPVEVIGGPTPKGRLVKASTIISRVGALRAWAERASPDVALSHNSYAQLMAARSLRIPAVTAMDFEHQPANHLAFRLADIVLMPEALRGTGVDRQGARDRNARFYPGLKEELYVGDFEPDPEVLERIGVRREPESIVVVARTPPSRALYHGFDSPLFVASLAAVCADERARLVVLTRHPDEAEAVAALGLPNCSVPREAVDSRSLMYAADLVLGAGGTMTREAALLGVPTFSLYSGTTPAVDRWLVAQGRLRRLESVNQLLPLAKTELDPTDVGDLRRRGSELMEHFVCAATLAPPPANADLSLPGVR